MKKDPPKSPGRGPHGGHTRLPSRRDKSARAPTPPHPRLTPQLAGAHPTPIHAEAQPSVKSRFDITATTGRAEPPSPDTAPHLTSSPKPEAPAALLEAQRSLGGDGGRRKEAEPCQWPRVISPLPAMLRCKW